MQYAGLADLRAVLEVLVAFLHLEARRRQQAVGPFHLLRLRRQNGAQHHRDLRAHDERCGGKIARGDAAGEEDVDFVRADHLPIDGDSLLGLGLVVLDNNLDLAAHDAAFGVHVLGRDFEAVAPSAVNRGRIARQPSRNPDLVDIGGLRGTRQDPQQDATTGGHKLGRLHNFLS